jgi:hypothetical protein
MTFVPIMWSVWSALVVIMAGLHVYRLALTKDEDTQVILDDSFERQKAEQAAIVARVNRVEPVLKVTQWLVAAMTVVVIAYYVRFILVALNVIQ